MKALIIKIIDFYRNYLSSLKISSCRYYPTCSQYTREAVEKYGVFRGLTKGALRILRCHPFSKSTYDPVEQK